jgi:hypothetical protein
MTSVLIKYPSRFFPWDQFLWQENLLSGCVFQYEWVSCGVVAIRFGLGFQQCAKWRVVPRSIDDRYVRQYQEWNIRILPPFYFFLNFFICICSLSVSLPPRVSARRGISPPPRVSARRGISPPQMTQGDPPLNLISVRNSWKASEVGKVLRIFPHGVQYHPFFHIFGWQIRNGSPYLTGNFQGYFDYTLVFLPNNPPSLRKLERCYPWLGVAGRAGYHCSWGITAVGRHEAPWFQ